MGIIPLYLILIWITVSYYAALKISNFTILEYNYSKNSFINWKTTPILKGEKVSAIFLSHANNIGIVAVRFNTFHKINNDTLTFRIKEKGTKNWYYQNNYAVDQFQPNQVFTFGFPVISNSENKEYEFEIESRKGKKNNSVAISSIDPPFVTRHEYLKSSLVSRNQKIYFFSKKLPLLIENQHFLLTSLLGLLPLLGYFLLLIFLIKVGVNKALLDRIDDFFLLENKKFPEFDGIRGVAILMVFTTHCIFTLSEIANADSANIFSKMLFNIFQATPIIGFAGGGIGLDMFFVLSGFLMYMITSKNNITFIHFLKKRLHRLLPANIAVAVPFLAMNHTSLIAILLNIFFIADFFPNFINVNIVTWTLSYELLFYVICGIWFILGKKIRALHSWKFFFAFSAFIYISPWIFNNYLHILPLLGIKYPDTTRFIALFFGVALAKFYFSEKEIWNKLQKLFAKLAIPSLIILLVIKQTYNLLLFDKKFGDLGINIYFLTLDIGIFLLFCSLLSSKNHILKEIFSSKILRVIGATSYSMYLTHLFWGIPLGLSIVSFIQNSSLKMVFFVPVAFATSFAIAIFLFHFLEKPYFLQRKK